MTDRTLLSQSSMRVWFTRNTCAYDALNNKSYIGKLLSIGNTGQKSGVIEYDHNTGGISKVQLRAAHEFDDHGETSIIIRSDGRLLAAYSAHNDARLRFKVSTNPGDITSWGSEIQINPGNYSNSYLSLFEASNGDIFCFHRDRAASLEARWSYYKSTDGGATWGSKVIMVHPGDGLGNQGYFIPAQDPNDPDIIHCVITRDQPTQLTGAFNTIWHFYIDLSTEQFYQSDGTQITATLPFGRSDCTLVQNTLGIGNDTAWIEDVIVDGNGYPRLLWIHYPDGRSGGTNFLNKDLYYTEWNGSAWTTSQFIHREASGYISTTEPPRMPCSCFLQSNPDVIIGCKEVNGIYELHRIERVSASSFTSEQISFKSMFHQWRPITNKAPDHNVFWLNSVMYDNYSHFDQQLLCGTIT